MGVYRNRAKQTSSLEERLVQFAADLERQIEDAEPDSETASQLRKRLRKSHAALQMTASLSIPSK